MWDDGCVAQLVSTDLTIDTAFPYAITASETNPAGYSLTICFLCKYKPYGTNTIWSYKVHGITVTQDPDPNYTPIDCSAALTSTSFANPANIPYNSAGSAVTIAADYTSIFTYSGSVDCPLIGCTLMLDTDCTTPLPPQTDVTITASPNFGLTATELNSLGYTVAFCYRCEITPTGLTSIFFDYTVITVIGDPLDCSTSLTSAGFTNPANIPYNSAGSAVTVAADVSAIFTHSNPNDCPLVGCFMQTDTDCTTPLPAQPDVTLGPSPNFDLSATEQNSLGYNVAFCYRCEITPTGQASIFFDQ